MPLATREDTDLEVSSEDVTVTDPDVDPSYHADFVLSVFGGEDYSHADTTITPSDNFFGDLQIPVSVSDGAAESPVFTLLVTVEPVDDAPEFTSTAPITASEASVYTYIIETMDPDRETAAIDGLVLASWLDLTDHGDGSATLSGVAGGDDVGDHPITVQAADSSGLTATQSFTITVDAATDSPVIEILGNNPLSINQGQSFVDPGATASDAQDGDLTAMIDVDSNVNVQIAGSYRVIYSVSDTAGQTTAATRNVTVRAVSTKRKSGGGSFGIIMLMIVFLPSLFRLTANWVET